MKSTPTGFIWPVAAGAVLTALVCSGFSCNSKSPGGSERVFQKGIAFTGYFGTAYEGDRPLLSLDHLRATDATWTSLLVTAYQDTVNSTTIDFSGAATPNDASLERIVREAHARGLKVMLKPHVDLANDPSHYRGEIGPNFTSAEWTAWFGSYRPFILHYAELAARTRCEMFCVGCELGTTAAHSDEWRRVVAEVRAVYSGPLTYADNLVETNPAAVAWWDAVDYIGQDAYPTLSELEQPSVDDLKQGWMGFREKLRALSQKWDKPLILTEIGARSVLGGARNPWDWQRQGPVDLTVQKNFYEAALSMVSGQSWLAGMFWWQWSPDPDDGGPTDTGYTPHGKPAEQVLLSWFRRPM
jgi:hypothetical protein